ncbi:MAG: cyclic pyranopterin monophosphate synthase MoaC [Planctomycetota bacterium]
MVLTATVSAEERTGVEMEALTAVSVAALALYDMVEGRHRSEPDDRQDRADREAGRQERRVAVPRTGAQPACLRRGELVTGAVRASLVIASDRPRAASGKTPRRPSRASRCSPRIGSSWCRC